MSVSSGLDYETFTAGLETLQTEIKKLEDIGTIVVCDHEMQEFIAPFFLKENTNVSKRLIYNFRCSHPGCSAKKVVL